MLILVGVTVTVALNGGLFQSAGTSAKQTQREGDREILQAAVIAALNDQLKIENAQAIKNNLPDGWDVTGDAGGPYTCTSPKENIFIVYENGKITEPWVDNGDGTFTKGDTTVEIGKTYTKAQFEDLLKELGIIEEYTGAYNGDWQLIGIEGGKLKLVSTENVSNNVILGYTDPNVYKKTPEGIITDELKDDIVDLNGDGNYNSLEIAVWSYTHAVDTLDEVAKDATGISSARSINLEDIETLAGIQDSEKGTEYLKAYTYNYTNSRDEIFVDESGETVIIDSEGKEVTIKNTIYNKTLSENEIGTLALGGYWLATPCVGRDTYYAYFDVHCMHGGYIGSSNLFTSNRAVSVVNDDGVRAVVSI